MTEYEGSQIPLPVEDGWFYVDANKQSHGPLEYSDLCKAVNSNTLVWNKCLNYETWIPLSTISSSLHNKEEDEFLTKEKWYIISKINKQMYGPLSRWQLVAKVKKNLEEFSQDSLTYLYGNYDGWKPLKLYGEFKNILPFIDLNAEISTIFNEEHNKLNHNKQNEMNIQLTIHGLEQKKMVL